jgi:hypothetical protein
MKKYFVNKITQHKQNHKDNYDQNKNYSSLPQTYFFKYIYVDNLSFVINYNLSDSEKKYINKENHIVIPWKYISTSNDQQLIEYISTLNFDFKYFTYIDKNILPKYNQLIHNIKLYIV